MPITDLSQLAQRHEEQGDPSSTPARRLLRDPAFPVPAQPCLPGPSLACQDVKEDSFLANWWSKVLDSSVAASANTHTSANCPGLHSRLQRRQHRRHTLNGQSPRCIGLQPRNCGRKGITLFKTESAGFPDQKGSEKVAALLANSKATQRHSHASTRSEPKGRQAVASEKRKKAKKALRQSRQGPDSAHQAQDNGAAHFGPVDAAPLDSSNIGSKMLVSMGWEAGTGLGSSLQGQIEPVLVIKRRKRLGLGA